MPATNVMGLPATLRSTSAISAVMTPESRIRLRRLCTAEADRPTRSPIASAFIWQSICTISRILRSKWSSGSMAASYGALARGGLILRGETAKLLRLAPAAFADCRFCVISTHLSLCLADWPFIWPFRNLSDASADQHALPIDLDEEAKWTGTILHLLDLAASIALSPSLSPSEMISGRPSLVSG
ncbi:hypothetical protein D9M70_567540 [compost metagenome]